MGVGKKKRKKEGNESAGRAPADLHPQLIADKGARAPFGKLGDRDFFTVSELAELPVNVKDM